MILILKRRKRRGIKPKLRNKFQKTQNTHAKRDKKPPAYSLVVIIQNAP